MKLPHFILQPVISLTLLLTMRLDVFTVVAAPETSQVAKTMCFPPQVLSFCSAKEQQAQKVADELKLQVSPAIWDYYKAAKFGDWLAASNTFERLKKLSSQYQGAIDDPAVGTPVWQTLIEIQTAIEAFALGEPRYALAFGEGIIQSIPRGSIYFGGSDPGRGVVTALCPSHANADPFFVVTQNALADGRYLEYLRWLYGNRLAVPGTNDSQKAFQDYLANAQKRRQHDRDFPTEPSQIKPGEDVRIVKNRVQVNGQVSVMAVNALLSKVIFDQNPDREFYVEESFPLDWMYPHLAPHGLIMKLHRSPLRSLSEEAVIADREFWTKQTDAMLGSWLREGTSVSEVCGFAVRVFLRKELSGFHGDRRFVEDSYWCKTYAKLRSALGGLYNWRAQHAEMAIERDRMIREADLAFRQALALGPCIPEAVFGYLKLLLWTGRLEDALSIAQMATKLQPGDGGFRAWANYLQNIKRGKWDFRSLGELMTIRQIPYAQSISNITLVAGPKTDAGVLDGEAFRNLLAQSAPASLEIATFFVAGLAASHAGGLDAEGFRQLLDHAAPPSPDLAKALQFAEWYRGTFAQNGRGYAFNLYRGNALNGYLGGIGFLAQPDGQRGFFTFKPTMTAATATENR